MLSDLWSLDHITDRCQRTQTCRLCSGPHPKTEHQSPYPTGCPRCALAQENSNHMDTSAEGVCPHELKCTNCYTDPKKDHEHAADSRRCPAGLERYGTARDNERHSPKTENPWIKAKTKKTVPKKKKPAAAGTPNPHPPIQTENRYKALTEHADETPSQELNVAPSQANSNTSSNQWF